MLHFTPYLSDWPAETGTSWGDGYYFVQLSTTLVFPHQDFQEEIQTNYALRHIFKRGLNGKNFLTLSWIEREHW